MYAKNKEYYKKKEGLITSMIQQTKNLFLKLLLTILLILVSDQPTKAAKKIALINGALMRTIPVDEIEVLAKKGKAEGFLGSLLKGNQKNSKEISEMLNRKIDMSLVVTSRLMNSSIGNVFLGRLSKVIHPLTVPQKSVSIPAIRAGVINGIVQTEGEGITIMNFLKAYPNDIMAIDIPELSKLVQKAESINELIRFFSDSPLERLKKPNQNLKIN